MGRAMGAGQLFWEGYQTPFNGLEQMNFLPMKHSVIKNTRLLGMGLKKH